MVYCGMDGGWKLLKRGSSQGRTDEQSERESQGFRFLYGRIPNKDKVPFPLGCPLKIRVSLKEGILYGCHPYLGKRTRPYLPYKGPFYIRMVIPP